MILTANSTFSEIVNSSRIIYPFGSYVYGTNDETSDHDFIAVLKDETSKSTPIIINDDENWTVHLYTLNEFLLKLDNHDISALECIYLNDDPLFKSNFKLNVTKLRESISTISSHSWVKGQKKLIVSGDYDKKAGLKSIFHSLRILDYGIQLAVNNAIVPKTMNWLWYELKQLGEIYDHDELWEKIDARYREIYHKTKSDFKKVAPKDISKKDISKSLESILKAYNCYSVDLKREIENLYI